MKLFLLVTLFTISIFANEEHNTPLCNPTQNINCDCKNDMSNNLDTMDTLSPSNNLRINVTGQGVAPMNTISPAQAYALAKRAAIADGYRLIAEKVKGVRVEGRDLVKNMMVKRSMVSTYVNAMVRNAEVLETTFKEGLCEVEMEIVLSYSQFVR